MEEFPHLVYLSEVEFYKLFFDREIEQLFVDSAKKYLSTQKNDISFSINDISFSMSGIKFFFLQTSTNLPCIVQKMEICHLLLFEIWCWEITKKAREHLHGCDNEKVSSEENWPDLLLQVATFLFFATYI